MEGPFIETCSTSKDGCQNDVEVESAGVILVSSFMKLPKPSRAEIICRLIEISDKEEMETILNELNEMLSDTDYNNKLDGDIKTEIEVVEDEVTAEQNKVVKLLECSKCNFRSCHSEVLEKHIFKAHENPDSYSCSECDFKSLKQDYIRLHQRVIHGGRDKVNCPYAGCDYGSKWKAVVNQHFQRVHEGLRYPCEQCDFEGLEKRHLKYHIKKCHQLSEIYSCSFCDHKTKDERSLKVHVNSKHHGNWYSCDQCDYKTGFNKDLRRHKNAIHLGIRHQCTMCDYKASYKANLSKHIKQVHKEGHESEYKEKKPKLFHCDICDHKVSWKGSLTRHIKTVHGNKIFSCDKCDYTGKRKDNLITHTKNVHSL